MGSVWIAWVGALVVCLAVAALFGAKLNGTVWGIFIDSRNTWSLTQFQIAIWTLTVLPVLVALVLTRAMHDPASAWNITFPGEVAAVMGISLGSTTSAIVIKNQKDKQWGTGALARGEQIATRVDARTARFFDMLSHDEGKGALKSLDVTKYQNFIFTLALVTIWLWNALWIFGKAKHASDLTTLPTFNQTALALLGVSHAGYLVGKATPQSGDIPAQDERGTPLVPAA